MSKQTLIIIIVVLVFGGLGLWFFYFQSSSSLNPPNGGSGEPQGGFSQTAADQSSTLSNPDVLQIEQELADLRRLKDLQLDTSILKNPFLQSLEPLKTPPPFLPSQTGTTTPSFTTPGRPNPFLPF